MERHLLNEETLIIRWADMDAYEHVAHQRYFDYLTETRHAELIKPYIKNQQEKFFLVDISCDFKKSLEYPGTVTVKQYLVSKGRSSFSFEFDFFNNQDTLVANAHATLVSVDAASHKTIEIPNYLQKKFPEIKIKKYDINSIQIPNELKPALTKTIPIRWSDIDAFGHVGNEHYFDYTIEARNAQFAESKVENEPCFFFVVNARCSFYKAFHYPGNVNVDLYLLDLKRCSFTQGYRFYLEGSDEIYAEAITTLACVDKIKRKPMRIPEQFSGIFR